jgi:hypothetical protein
VDERNGRFKPRVGQILVVRTDLIRQEHALVDHGRGRQRHDVEAVVLALRLAIDAVGDHFAKGEQPAFELGIVGNTSACADENLQVERLGRGDVRRLGKR